MWNGVFDESLISSWRVLVLWISVYSLSLAAMLDRGNIKPQDAGTGHFLSQDEEIEVKDAESRLFQFPAAF